MRLHRFYIDKKIDSQEVLIKDEKLIHQWRDVFRYNVGTEVILFDGSGSEFDAVIESLNNREASVRIVEERRGLVPKSKITLFISLIKKDNLELVIEKATELGVSKIVPVLSERSEKKGFNLERAKRIVIEASEQCGRADVPEITSIKQLVDSIEEAEGETIVFDPSGESFELKAKSLEGQQTPSSKLKTLSLFVGPEGGWSPKELELFKDKTRPNASGGREARIYSMGPLVLRAETAAIAALSLLTL